MPYCFLYPRRWLLFLSGSVPKRHGDVESLVSSVDGQTIMVKYKDGEKKVIVPPGTPVVSFAPGSKADLKAGAQIFVLAGQKQADGSITAPAITVGRDGAAPPM